LPCFQHDNADTGRREVVGDGKAADPGPDDDHVDGCRVDHSVTFGARRASAVG
jgi:hypothetical protein